MAGDALIHFMGRGNHTEVNTFPDEPFSSYFSGNTVQICPVGALTAAPYRFKARPWDLTETLSTAWVDSVGARVAVQASRNRVLRVLGADADAVNWGWLSDKERFGFEALNSDDRLAAPMIKDAVGSDSREFRQAGWGEALDEVAAALAAASPERVAVLGGARLTNEAQYVWAKLAKGVIGTDNVDAQLGDGLDPGLVLGLPRATIDDACRAGGTVLLMGPDPKEELGTLYLRLRHAIVNDGVKLIEVTPHATGLSHLAEHSLRPNPGTTAGLVAELVAAAATDAAREAEGSDAGRAELEAAAQCLREAEGGVTVVLGRMSLAEPADAVGAAARELASLPSARFLPALRRGNLMGALEAGLAPGLVPGRVRLEDVGHDAPLARAWPRLPATAGLDAAAILRAAARGDIDVLVLVGSDPLNDFVNRDLAYRGLRGAALVVAVDLFVNDSASLAAGIVLPAAGPTECDGTFTNLEGRVSVMSRKVTPPGTARPDWMIAADLSERLEPGSTTGLDSGEAIRAELARVSEVHSSIGTAGAIEANRLEGVLLPAPEAVVDADAWHDAAEEVPGEGEFVLVATRAMYDDGVMLRHCPSSRGLARAATARISPADFDGIDLEAGAAVRVVSDFGHIEATLTVDSGVPAGSLGVDWLSPGAPANALIALGTDVTVVRVEAR